MGPGQQRLKAAEKQLALSGESRPRREKARLEEKGVFFHDAGKEKMQLQRVYHIILSTFH